MHSASASGPTVTAPATPTPGIHAHRVIFIDLARAMAVVMMVYGHTVSALLAEPYRAGRVYEAWQFQRGLTSCLFLILSGFAFSIATSRHWQSHLQFSPALVRRVRRFGLFIVLGYALHFPVGHVGELFTASAERWRSFLVADVLQLIGVTFISVQLLVMAARTRVRFTVVAFVLAIGLVLLTPVVWGHDWTGVLPVWIASYLSPATGSQFPLFPWAAYVLIGAGAGQVYARWGAAHLGTFATRVLLLPGIVLLALSLGVQTFTPSLFGSGEWHWVPTQVMMRVGACLVILGLVAHASRWIAHLPHVFGAVAQESLLIYFVHLCIVYGSIWNTGLAQWFGPELNPAQTFLVTVALLAAMTLLAWQWNRAKHVRPRATRWVSAATGAWLVYVLL